MPTLDSHVAGSIGSDVAGLTKSCKDLWGLCGCGVLVQDDDHEFCTSHSACAGYGEYNPEVFVVGLS